jgi:hypothetical protein
MTSRRRVMRTRATMPPATARIAAVRKASAVPCAMAACAAWTARESLLAEGGADSQFELGLDLLISSIQARLNDV